MYLKYWPSCLNNWSFNGNFTCKMSASLWMVSPHQSEGFIYQQNIVTKMILGKISAWGSVRMFSNLGEMLYKVIILFKYKIMLRNFFVIFPFLIQFSFEIKVGWYFWNIIGRILLQINSIGKDWKKLKLYEDRAQLRNIIYIADQPFWDKALMMMILQMFVAGETCFETRSKVIIFD